MDQEVRRKSEKKSDEDRRLFLRRVGKAGYPHSSIAYERH